MELVKQNGMTIVGDSGRRYQVGVTLLGEGSFAKVVTGADPEGTPVAIRLVDATSSRQYRADKLIPLIKSEYETVKKLQYVTNHINLVKIIDFSVLAPDYSRVAFIMELCETTLRGMVAAGHNYWQYVRDIANGLAALHEIGVIHRDIKPENCMIRDGHVKLSDYGFIKHIDTQMTQTVLGSFVYMAPEVKNRQPYGKPADIYSLGILMYELAVGSIPTQIKPAAITDVTLRDLLFKRMFADDPRLRPTAVEIVAIADKMLYELSSKLVSFNYIEAWSGSMTTQVARWSSTTTESLEGKYPGLWLTETNDRLASMTAAELATHKLLYYYPAKKSSLKNKVYQERAVKALASYLAHLYPTDITRKMICDFIKSPSDDYSTKLELGLLLIDTPTTADIMVASCHAELGTTASKYFQADMELKYTKDSNQQLHQELALVKAELSKKNGELEGVKTDLVKKSGELDSVKAELCKKSTELEGVRAELVKVKDELDGVRSLLAKEASNSEATRIQSIMKDKELQDAKTQLVSAKTDLTKKTEELENVRKNFDAVFLEAGSSRRMIVSQSRQIADLEAAMKSKSSPETSKLQEELIMKQTVIERLQHQLVMERGKLALSSSQQLSDLEGKLKAQLMVRDQQIIDLTHDRDHLATEVDTLKVVVADYTSEIRTKDSIITELQHKNKQLTVQIIGFLSKRGCE